MKNVFVQKKEIMKLSLTNAMVSAINVCMYVCMKMSMYACNDMESLVSNLVLSMENKQIYYECVGVKVRVCAYTYMSLLLCVHA